MSNIPYHLDYTHALFRDWYHFGAGYRGDIGNYSLWRTYRMLDPGPVVRVGATPATGCVIVGNQCRWWASDVAFPSPQPSSPLCASYSTTSA